MKEQRFKIRIGRLKGGIMFIPGLSISWSGQGIIVSVSWVQFFMDALCKYRVKDITIGRRQRRALSRVK